MIIVFILLQRPFIEGLTVCSGKDLY